MWDYLQQIPFYVAGPISFVLLVFASWCVGEGGEILGKKYDASIIGGLIIAWLNTAPEAIFFITALNSNNPRFAVGAVSGSSIVVCTVALGVCLWIGAKARKSGIIILQPAVKKQCAILGGSLVVTMLIALTGFTLPSAFLGVGFYMCFIYFSLTASDSQVAEETDAKQQDEELGGDQSQMGQAILTIIPGESEEEEEEVEVSKGVGYLLLGGLLIIMFSSVFINSVVEAAAVLQVNPILLAFFLAPIASEAPEILESISLSRKGSSQNINIAYSNLIGGTITKTTLLCGVYMACILPSNSPRYSAFLESGKDLCGKHLPIPSVFPCSVSVLVLLLVLEHCCRSKPNGTALL